MRTKRWGLRTIVALLWAPFLAALMAAPLAPVAAAEGNPAGDAASNPARDKALGELLDAAYGPKRAAAESHGRELFDAVLGRPVFRHIAVGPFDLYAYEAGNLAKAKDSQKALADAAAGLGKAAAVLARCFDRHEGLVSGRRFPIVLASSGSAPGGDAYEQVVALLDRCEDDGFSGWKPVNAVWGADNLHSEVTRTWDVQVFNLANATIASQGKAWFEHGIGYYAIAHVANDLLRQGAWGNVPPWLAQGLIDELDIEAYGQAWVGGEWFQAQTPGWSRPGWSGFVPQGSSPPPPVTGPPADLGVTVQKSGHPWEQREASATRHWSELATDRKSVAPASFAFMARHESFFPRDRAFARCVLNLMLDIAPPHGDGLLQCLDHKADTPASGMPAADPLPAVFARALGGVPELEQLEAQPLESMLSTIGHSDIAAAIRALDAADMLAIPDHRAQAQWLYQQPWFAPAARGQLFNLILKAEYYEQLHEWDLIGQHLDAAANAALAACSHYPKSVKERSDVADAFRKAIGP